MVSERKLAANRANALRSTGPRTAAGKATSSLNAVVHGLRAAAVLGPGESAAEWEAFRTEFVTDLAPVGLVEGEDARRAAEYAWRLRRVPAFEAAAAFAALTAPPPDSRVRIESTTHFGADGPSTELAVLSGPAGEVLDYQAHHTLDAARAATRDAVTARRVLAAAPSDPVARADALGLLERLDDYLDGGATLLAPIPRRRDDRALAERLAAAGVPSPGWGRPAEWPGWTAAHVRRAAGGKRLLAEAAAAAESVAAVGTAIAAGVRAAHPPPPAKTPDDRRRAAALVAVPSATELDRTLRYERMIQKQLDDTLARLARRQAVRLAAPPAPDTDDPRPDDPAHCVELN